MVIKNARVYTAQKTFAYGEICMQNDVFATETDNSAAIDAGGCYAIPGLIDMHFHGCMGYDICDGTQEAIAQIAGYEASVGVTAIAPATMTLPTDELEHILSVAAAYRREQDPKGADLVGINMEGPFISKAKKGAQDARNILPCSIGRCQRFLDASEGLVKLIGIAPEENPDFRAFIQQMKEKVTISLAHTNADYDTAMAAFSAGASHAVHLYNAMPAFTHREPGVVGAVCDCLHVTAELICDGVHIHPAVVRATFEMLGADRIVLISDSMRAAGMPDGQYTLGGLDVSVTGNRATLVADGALAGSVTNLMDCMRIAVRKMHIPLETAVACATMNPAKCLGISDLYGSIQVGKKANVVLLDEKLNLQAVIKDGRMM